MPEPKPTVPVSPAGSTATPSGVIADLVRDHGLILRATVALERCAARLTAPGEVDKREREHLALLLGFFRDFAEGIHDAKEEEALIPALVGAGVPADTGIVREIMDVHLQATERLARVTAKRAEPALEPIADYSELLRQHLRAEEHSLFPLVERFLDPASEQRVLVGFRQIEARAGDERGYDGFDREIGRLLAPLDQLYPDRKRPW